MVQDELHSHAEHHSVFAIHMHDLDSPTFWTVFTGMIAFTIFIDRVCHVIEGFAKDSEPLRLFLDRVYSELMMFGIVAICLFVFTNLCSHMSQSTHLTFEFVDIMCSFGACGLIFIAAIFFALDSVSDKHWKNMENDETKYGAEFYMKMRSAFIQKTAVPDDFRFHDYLERQLGTNVIEVMNVHWTTWVILFLFPAIGLFDRVYLRAPDNEADRADANFLESLAALNWLTFAGHLAVILWLRWAEVQLEASVEVGLHSHQKFQEMATTQAITQNNLTRMHHIVQILSLVNAFLIALYLMAGLYNSEQMSNSWFWFLVEGSALGLNVTIMLPFILYRSSVVGGFFVPCAKHIGAVLEAAARVSEDVAHLQQAWRERGRPMPKDLEAGELTEEQFSHTLHDLGLWISGPRQRRLFCHMDKDKGGTVSKKEFVAALADVEECTVFTSADNADGSRAMHVA